MAGNIASEWLKPITAPLRPLYRDVAFVSLFVNLLAMAVPIFTSQVYDRVIFHAGLNTLNGLVIGMLAVFTFDYLLRNARSRMMQRASLEIDVKVGRSLYKKIMALPLSELEKQPSAYWQALFRDVETVRNTLSGPTAILAVDLPFAVLFLGLIIVMAAPIAWVLAVLLPAFVVIGWRSAREVGAASQSERKSGFARDTLMSEFISGRATVKALALDEDIRPMWESRQAETIERSMMRGRQADKYVNLGAGLASFTTVAMTTVGALAIMDQQLTIGALIATNMLSNRIIGPFNQLVGSWRSYASFKQAVTRLTDAFNLPQERQEISIAHDRPSGLISMENVRFQYAPDGPAIIDGVRLKVRPGGLVAIVGSNGCGKSTLVKLMQGLYRPTSGRILLDGADVKQFTRAEMASWMGYVPQEVFLFEGTVRDNIAKGHIGATDEEIIAASKKAGLHELIIDFPDGYATDIGEAGSHLSGGLRQRLSIARALLGDPPVLLLDEPSSNLDREGEQELAQTLNELAADHTVIVISHSPGLLAMCKQVLVMQKGRIVRSGRPIDVLPHLLQAAIQPGDLRRHA
jgi:ATP-binding cassette subfamily C protein LapB